MNGLVLAGAHFSVRPPAATGGSPLVLHSSTLQINGQHALGYCVVVLQHGGPPGALDLMVHLQGWLCAQQGQLHTDPTPRMQLWNFAAGCMQAVVTTPRNAATLACSSAVPRAANRPSTLHSVSHSHTPLSCARHAHNTISSVHTAQWRRAKSRGKSWWWCAVCTRRAWRRWVTQRCMLATNNTFQAGRRAGARLQLLLASTVDDMPTQCNCAPPGHTPHAAWQAGRALSGSNEFFIAIASKLASQLCLTSNVQSSNVQVSST